MKPTAAATIKNFDEILEKIQTTKTFKPSRTFGEKGNTGRLDVPAYCSAFGVEIVKTKDAPGGGAMYCLKHCIFDKKHTPNEASIIQQVSGRLIYQCFHDSCSGRTWHDARRVISGEHPLVQWLIGGNGHYQFTKPATQMETATLTIKPQAKAPASSSSTTSTS